MKQPNGTSPNRVQVGVGKPTDPILNVHPAIVLKGLEMMFVSS